MHEMGIERLTDCCPVGVMMADHAYPRNGNWQAGSILEFALDCVADFTIIILHGLQPQNDTLLNSVCYVLIFYL